MRSAGARRRWRWRDWRRHCADAITRCAGRPTARRAVSSGLMASRRSRVQAGRVAALGRDQAVGETDHRHGHVVEADLDATLVGSSSWTVRSKPMAFVCCNSDHHAVVITDAPVNGLNHVAFLMPDLEPVMRGSGRMVDAGYPPIG